MVLGLYPWEYQYAVYKLYLYVIWFLLVTNKYIYDEVMTGLINCDLIGCVQLGSADTPMYLRSAVYVSDKMARLFDC